MRGRAIIMWDTIVLYAEKLGRTSFTAKIKGNNRLL